jgi:malonate-semialdehyde dehydrogenase (acetylating)/methylmalonate-semialdehyde dehydrogenase
VRQEEASGCHVKKQVYTRRIKMSDRVLSDAGTLSNFVDGALQSSTSDRYQPVINPSTGEELTRVPLSNAADLDAAVSAAARAQKEWSARPLKDRVQVMYRMKSLVEKEIDHLAHVVTLEN